MSCETSCLINQYLQMLCQHLGALSNCCPHSFGRYLVQSLETSTGSDLANIPWGYKIGFATWVHDLNIHPRLISSQYTPLVYIVYKYALKHIQKSRAQARRLHSLKYNRYMPRSAPLVMYKRCLKYIANGKLPLHILRSRPNI